MDENKCFWHNEEKCQTCLLILSIIADENRNKDDYDTVIHITHESVKEWSKYLKTVEEFKSKIVFNVYKEILENKLKG